MSGRDVTTGLVRVRPGPPYGTGCVTFKLNDVFPLAVWLTTIVYVPAVTGTWSDTPDGPVTVPTRAPLDALTVIVNEVAEPEKPRTTDIDPAPDPTP